MNTIHKVMALHALCELRETFRREGKIVVFTNGCFDLLHIGHVRCLQQARQLGNVLIVGINSDSSVRALKGVPRPFMTQQDRAEVLAALASVDYIVIFNELTPNHLIETLKPDIHCKGGDWRDKPMPEAAVIQRYGGKIYFLPYQTGYSTTALVQTICASDDHNL